jgi:hypothetical protein
MKVFELIQAASAADLHAIFFKNFEEKLKRDRTARGMEAEQAFKKVLSIDPTPNLEYSKWVLSKYTKTDVLLEDVISTYAEALAVFHKAKATKKLPIEYRDIFKIKDFDTLFDITRQYADVSSSNDEEREAKKGAVKLADTNDALILQINTKEAAMFYGKHTKWCTAAIYNNQANIYLKNGPLYIFINKKNNKKYQLESPGLYHIIQFKNELDKSVNKYKILESFIGLKEAILATKNNYLIDYFLRKPKEWTHFGLLKHILNLAINLPGKLKFYGISTLNENTINMDAIKKSYTLYDLYLKATKKSIKDSNFDYENLETPEDFYLYAKNELKARFPEAESVILRDAEIAYLYARDVIKDRWKEAEPIILKDPKIACLYSRDVIKGRWKEAEPIIMQSRHVMHYIMKVLKKRWPEAEESIVKYCEGENIPPYISHYVNTRTPVFEKLIIKQLTNGDKISDILSPYISNIRQRIPAIEEALLKSKDVRNIFNYTIYCIRGQWLEGEEYIVKMHKRTILLNYILFFNEYMYYLADNKDRIKSKKYIPKLLSLLKNSIDKDEFHELAKKLGVK